jgi:hydroxyacid-oxoacid transhydrogenase
MSLASPASPESVFTYGAPQLKFGEGASDEIGFDLSRLGVHRVLVVTDAGVAATGLPQRVAEQMATFDIEAHVFDGVHIEPTDVSLQAAIEEARESGPWDAFVAVGGGSSIDTAKAINLLTTNPGELMDYINLPVGKGQAPSEPLKPLVAVPTTTGTGSESTTICVMDVLSLRVKTGISHARLRPTMAVIDPALTFTQPPGVTAAAGMDILCHALESYTARWFTTYERKKPEERVPYCGSNPISAGQVKEFHPKDYPADEPMVPHGMSVALTAPEAFRFTFEAAPDRHIRAAQLLAPNAGVPAEPAEFLPTVLADLMRDIDIPNGIGAVGFDEGDIPDLVQGTMKQQRLLATCPREVTEEDIAGIFTRSLSLW